MNIFIGEKTFVANLLVAISICFGLSACSSIPASSVASSNQQAMLPSGEHIDIADQSKVRSQLLQQLAEWQGVPHRDGGLSKRGGDCSGFVYLTFADEFGIRLPRTTARQVQQGVVVAQQDLIPGDLVFFKTGIKQRHVGIYVGKNQFIHTSSSRGVMSSRLDNPYWQDAYWHSRRVVR